jgi:O-methyltransferase
MMKEEVISEMIKKHGIIKSFMISDRQMPIILSELYDVLDNGIDGDIVELGCNVGTASVYIRRLLDHFDSPKGYHVYDSFMGLPDKSIEDACESDQYHGGYCRVSMREFEMSFSGANLRPPTINVGWFKDIPDGRYPSKIAFAFFDGDFYSSIVDSFMKCGEKMSVGSVVVVHDYTDPRLPGVKKACDDYLSDHKYYRACVSEKMLICRKSLDYHA